VQSFQPMNTCRQLADLLHQLFKILLRYFQACPRNAGPDYALNSGSFHVLFCRSTLRFSWPNAGSKLS
jgi:hypothetical protein